MADHHRNQRSPQAQAYRRLYNTARWQRIRKAQLTAHPLCAMCLAVGRITPATVCDHIDPKTKATEQGFFAGPFQSLCDDPRYRCHSSAKQSEETKGYSMDVGADGTPTDPRHPFNANP